MVLPTKVSVINAEIERDLARQGARNLQEREAMSESTKLHPVMWVWCDFGTASRWVLAVKSIQGGRTWALYEAGGGWFRRIDANPLRTEFYHHTPIYAPRSTPE